MAGTATEPLAGRTAVELAAAVRQGRASPLDVVEAHLERIAALDPRVHAFQLVRRLREAGAVPIGKTTMPELGLWPFTETAAFGATRNPWSLDHTPSGSTGGGAAAVAGAMAPLALGSDGGGSIRMPAACCGLSEPGPLATTVADVALVLDVLAGTSAYRAVAPPGRALRIAASSASPAVGVKVRPEVERCFRATVEALRGAGHELVAARPPYRPTDTFPFLHRAFVGGAEEADPLRFEALERRTRSWVRTGRWLRRVRRPSPASADAVRRRFQGWFERSGYDLLLTPTLATPPLRIGAYQGKGLWPTILGLTRFMPFTPLMNLTGFPAMSVPAGRSSDGLPIGVQLAAPRGGEALLLSVARQLETLQPWPRHAPVDLPSQRS